jgi:hypothetical protein
MVDHFKPCIFQSLVGLHCVLIPKEQLKDFRLKFIKKIDCLRDKGNLSFVLNYVPLYEVV